ncbi:alpha/beta hydrolase [Mumia sp. zg.B53]|uniref:alpha/beta fold hydrolase n=1 Tax=Mumia sp. zg.B53 TaxID=2855449 RepID=UPI001C6E828C|nr:alpha/beta fold hydrolase [Mumia sp. zg.B53]MBW9213653.1 alpha/beta hydrolase [Mumia sp. zg.B53]
MQLTRTYERQGRSVAWDRLGSGPAVVMCHGTPWSSALWQPFAEALSREFAVYLWDMPGYGQSSMNPGGAVSLRALLLHGASFASLALVEGIAGFPT